MIRSGTLAAAVAATLLGMGGANAGEGAARPDGAAGIEAVDAAARFFAEQASFDRAIGNPGGLAMETFVAGDGVSTPTGCGEPLGATSDDACFHPGDLIAGFAVTSTSGAGTALLPPDFFGPAQTEPAVGASTFTDGTLISFDPPVTAVSADAFGGIDGTSAENVVLPVQIEAFDASGLSLGAITVRSDTVDVPAFFGIVASAGIGHVELHSQSPIDGGEVFNRLRFGTAGLGAPVVATAFTPSTVAAGTPTTLTVTLSNPQGSDATLTSDFFDRFPSGLDLAGNPSSDCAGIALGLTKTLFAVSAGSVIPANSQCTVSLALQASTVGRYVNSLGVGALQTDLGSNVEAVESTLTVTTDGALACGAADSVFCDSFDPLAL